MVLIIRLYRIFKRIICYSCCNFSFNLSDVFSQIKGLYLFLIKELQNLHKRSISKFPDNIISIKIHISNIKYYLSSHDYAETELCDERQVYKLM